MENISLKKIIVYGLISGIILLLIPIFIYGYNFHWNNLSNNTSDWGSFSDFVGGILNPIFCIINALILVILTYKVASWETNREKDSLRREYRMRNYELMYSTLKDFSKILSKLGEVITSSVKNASPIEFGLIRLEFEALVIVNKNHFNYLNNTEKITKIVADIKDVMNMLKKGFYDKSNVNDEEIYTNLKKLFEDYGVFLKDLKLELDSKYTEIQK